MYNLILFSVNNIIRLYNIQNIEKHQNEINDLLKIDNNKFIYSSKNGTINNMFALNNNFLNYRIISIINTHNDEVNQTIK